MEWIGIKFSLYVVFNFHTNLSLNIKPLSAQVSFDQKLWVVAKTNILIANQQMLAC